MAGYHCLMPLASSLQTAPICLSASSLLSINPEKFDMASLSIEKEIRHKKRQKETSSYTEQTIG
jgi:hypothetical protein